MTMDFLFSQEIDQKNLHQGDLLQNSGLLNAAIAQAHSHYANAPDYTHFIVLTQSCDLVRRNGRCKASYLTIAAVRPLSLVTERFISKHRDDGVNFPFQVCKREARVYADQFLERLLHNTEETYFFLRKGSAPTVIQDLCAFLHLSIALRREHYDACLSAKVGQLNNIFAAKLGWLTGNLYSRIATPDLEEILKDQAAQYKAEFFDEVLHERTVWLSPMQIRILKRSVNAWIKANPGKSLGKEEALQMLNELPDDLTLIAARAVEVLRVSGLIENDQYRLEEAKKALLNDVNFQKLARSST